MVMYDLYETEYGIHDHLNLSSDRTLGSVAYFESEDFTDNSTLVDLGSLYIDKDIKGTFGIDFLEFMELPTCVTDTLAKLADDKMNTKRKAMEEVEEEFKKM